MARPVLVCFCKTQHLTYSICFSFLRKCLSFPRHLCKVTFDIPEAYLEPNQLPKMELFVRIVKGFQTIIICKKLHLRCLIGFFIQFGSLFTGQANLLQKMSQVNRIGLMRYCNTNWRSDFTSLWWKFPYNIKNLNR